MRSHNAPVYSSARPQPGESVFRLVHQSSTKSVVQPRSMLESAPCDAPSRRCFAAAACLCSRYQQLSAVRNNARLCLRPVQQLQTMRTVAKDAHAYTNGTHASCTARMLRKVIMASERTFSETRGGNGYMYTVYYCAYDGCEQGIQHWAKQCSTAVAQTWSVATLVRTVVFSISVKHLQLSPTSAGRSRT